MDLNLLDDLTQYSFFSELNLHIFSMDILGVCGFFYIKQFENCTTPISSCFMSEILDPSYYYEKLAHIS